MLRGVAKQTMQHRRQLGIPRGDQGVEGRHPFGKGELRVCNPRPQGRSHAWITEASSDVVGHPSHGLVNVFSEGLVAGLPGFGHARSATGLEGGDHLTKHPGPVR